ncbi:mismatch-specific DNA-glycosylase [Fertoeibacter niger]|nr:mismatch-specific DNA-glycosylase [Fertoeibacter niger]
MLADHLAPGLAIIFCGTAVGAASARAGHYYAGPGNLFWPLLAETGLTPRKLAPQEDHLLPGFGLGLTDLAKGVAGQDAAIPRAAYTPERVLALALRWQPRALAFTSLAAARIGLGNRHLCAGRLEADVRLPGVALWSLPSPSGLARGHFRRGPWDDLAAWRKELR